MACRCVGSTPHSRACHFLSLNFGFNKLNNFYDDPWVAFVTTKEFMKDTDLKLSYGATWAELKNKTLREKLRHWAQLSKEALQGRWTPELLQRQDPDKLPLREHEWKKDYLYYRITRISF